MAIVFDKEQSRAMPTGFYGDPAKVIEIKQLNDLGCRACAKHVTVGVRVACCEPKKTSYKDVPRIGSKCKFFELKG